MKRSYQVKRHVDDSVKYFEVAHLLGDGSDEDEGGDKTKAVEPSTDPAILAAQQRYEFFKRKAEVRTCRFASTRDSILNSEELDEITNVKRYQNRFLSQRELCSSSHCNGFKAR